MTKMKRIACLFCILFAVQYATAQQATPAAPPQMDPGTLTQAQIARTQVPLALYRLAAVYKQKGDLQRLVWTLQRLIFLQPNVGDLKFALATAYAGQGEKSKTYDVLLALQKQGYGYDLAGNENFAKVSDTRVWTYIADGLKSNLTPFGKGSIAFSLPKGDFLFESMAFDPKRKQFLVGSVRDGKVSLVDRNGRLTDFIAPNAQNGLWGADAIAVDPARDLVYVASTASVFQKNFSKESFGKAGVFKFSLSTGKALDKYLLPADAQPHSLSSITVSDAGQVFVADGQRNTIYRLDGGALKVLVENPRLTSIRGLAVSGDSKTLYFADYAQGIFGVDLAAGKGFDLRFDPQKLSLGGIDGLYWYDNNLVVIEGGMTPHRIMRLALDGEGRSVVKATPLDSGSPDLTAPTYGAVDGEGLYFIANSQKSEYDGYGSPKDAAKLQAVHVFRSDMRFAWDERGIDTRLDAARPIPGLAAGFRSKSVPGSGVFRNVVGGID